MGIGKRGQARMMSTGDDYAFGQWLWKILTWVLIITMGGLMVATGIVFFLS